MPDQPFLTVTTPTYNRAAMLRRCLDSQLVAKAPDIEFLVSDNASPDSTPEVLKSYSDPRLRSWRNPQNVGAERNILGLWQQARGEWILCITDDDYFMGDALDHLIARLRTLNDVGAVLSDLQVVDEAGASQWVYSFHDRQAEFAPGMEALKNMVWAAHVFSRIALRRKWLDLPGVERHLASMYPQMYAVGSIVKEHPGVYLKESFIAHTTGNRTFWEYPPDFMTSTRMQLVNDLLPGARWKRERKTLINQIIREIAKHQLPVAWKEGRFLKLQRELMKTPEVRGSFLHWRRTAKFLLSRKA